MNQVAANPWSRLPSLGDLNSYIRAVQTFPMLEEGEEKELARRLRENDDLDAAGRLTMSHLRLVVSIARKYRGYGLPQEDLIQEGNIGLMRAVKKFDPSTGVRLVNYAILYIKGGIHDYILKNWRIVKIATTKAQKKLFFNLRSLKNEIRDGEEGTLSPSEISRIASELTVKESEVIEMESRFSGGDLTIDQDEEDDAFYQIELIDSSHEPTHMLESMNRESIISGGIMSAISSLDERTQRIIKSRWVDVNDDGSGGKTLQELAEEFGVSLQRIKQIEVAAMKKMRAILNDKS